MRIKNTTTKAIGFGTVTIMPGAVGDTPKGFDKGHPVVGYYFTRGWIEEIDGADTRSGVGTDGGAKPVERMNKDELTALAVEMGLEVTETDTKQAILDSIKAMKQANE